jgi:hypothetical protein
MCANSTGRAPAFLSASDAAVSQEVADVKISIQSACALNTRYFHVIMKSCGTLRLFLESYTTKNILNRQNLR